MIELTIDDLSHDARGIAHRDGKAVFVSGALPGERISVQRLHQGKAFDQGALTSLADIIERSSERTEPKCAHFGVCSGCSLQHLDSAAQIRYKNNHLREDLRRIGRVEPLHWLAPLTADIWGYRHKARLSVKDVQKKGKVLVGFREIDGRFVADVAHCHTLAPVIGSRIADLAALIQTLNARREIPQIELAIADNACALVFRHLSALSISDQSKLREFGDANDLQIWLQPKGPDTVHCISANPAPLRYQLPAYGLDVEFLPLDFTQVNPSLNQKMLAQALELLALKPGDSVLELFCGLGNFTLPMAQTGAQIFAVEGDAGLVKRARANAERHQLADKIRYLTANLFEPQSGNTWAKAPYNKLLLDPPRAGAEQILRELPNLSAERIVYVSCNPATFARDAEILVHQRGYQLHSAGVMDMFTHTSHVESIALFTKNKS